MKVLAIAVLYQRNDFQEDRPTKLPGPPPSLAQLDGFIYW